jgi:hypothetical protein
MLRISDIKFFIIILGTFLILFNISIISISCIDLCLDNIIID